MARQYFKRYLLNNNADWGLDYPRPPDYLAPPILPQEYFAPPPAPASAPQEDSAPPLLIEPQTYFAPSSSSIPEPMSSSMSEPQNAAPQASKGGMSVRAGAATIITPDILHATDAEGDTINYQFSIAALAGGLLQVYNAAHAIWETIEVGGGFTQDDLDARYVRYVAADNPLPVDFLDFAVSDANAQMPTTLSIRFVSREIISPAAPDQNNVIDLSTRTASTPTSIESGAGDDIITGSSANDLINSGIGNDRINLQSDNDDASTDGADIVIYETSLGEAGEFVARGGADVITGFTPGEDRLVFSISGTQGYASGLGHFLNNIEEGRIIVRLIIADDASEVLGITFLFLQTIMYAGGRAGGSTLSLYFATAYSSERFGELLTNQDGVVEYNSDIASIYSARAVRAILEGGDSIATRSSLEGEYELLPPTPRTPPEITLTQMQTQSFEYGEQGLGSAAFVLIFGARGIRLEASAIGAAANGTRFLLQYMEGEDFSASSLTYSELNGYLLLLGGTRDGEIVLPNYTEIAQIIHRGDDATPYQFKITTTGNAYTATALDAYDDGSTYVLDSFSGGSDARNVETGVQFTISDDDMDFDNFTYNIFNGNAEDVKNNYVISHAGQGVFSLAVVSGAFLLRDTELFISIIDTSGNESNRVEITLRVQNDAPIITVRDIDDGFDINSGTINDNADGTTTGLLLRITDEAALTPNDIRLSDGRFVLAATAEKNLFQLLVAEGAVFDFVREPRLAITAIANDFVQDSAPAEIIIFIQDSNRDPSPPGFTPSENSAQVMLTEGTRDAVTPLVAASLDILGLRFTAIEGGEAGNSLQIDIVTTSTPSNSLIQLHNNVYRLMLFPDQIMIGETTYSNSLENIIAEISGVGEDFTVRLSDPMSGASPLGDVSAFATAQKHYLSGGLSSGEIVDTGLVYIFSGEPVAHFDFIVRAYLQGTASPDYGEHFALVSVDGRLDDNSESMKLVIVGTDTPLNAGNYELTLIATREGKSTILADRVALAISPEPAPAPAFVPATTSLETQTDTLLDDLPASDPDII